MTDLNCSTLVRAIKGDFGALWNCRERGATLEITTPYVYPDNSFVTIFVTKRGRRFIVSDAGQASELFQPVKDDEPFFASLISRARATHRVSEFKQGNRTFYYKDTEKLGLISSLAFDVANFLVSSTSAAALAAAEEDSIDKNSFRVRADTFIKHHVPRSSGKSVHFNQKLPEVKEATFNAVITGRSYLWLVIYLTGSNLKYFQLTVSNAIVNVEFLHKSSIKDRVRSVIPLLDDDADGYQPNRLTQRLGALEELTKIQAIPWGRKEEIIRLVAA